MTPTPSRALLAVLLVCSALAACSEQSPLPATPRHVDAETAAQEAARNQARVAQKLHAHQLKQGKLDALEDAAQRTPEDSRVQQAHAAGRQAQRLLLCRATATRRQAFVHQAEQSRARFTTPELKAAFEAGAREEVRSGVVPDARLCGQWLQAARSLEAFRAKGAPEGLLPGSISPPAEAPARP